MREVIFFLLWLSGIPLLLRLFLQRNKTTILCYHDPSPEIMREHLKVLKARYNIISLRRYIDWRTEQTDTTLPPYAMVITLDDGHKGNAALATVFKHLGIKPTIFLCSAIVGTSRHYWWLAHNDHSEMVRLTRTDNRERIQSLGEVGFTEEKEYQDRQSLSTEEIISLDGIVDFQSHTRFHPILPKCSPERIVNEIGGSKSELKDRFGLTAYALAYPNGDYSDRETEVVRKAGYTCALTLGWGYNSDCTPLQRLMRLSLSDEADKYELIVKASGLWSLIGLVFGRRPQGYMHIETKIEKDVSK